MQKLRFTLTSGWTEDLEFVLELMVRISKTYGPTFLQRFVSGYYFPKSLLPKAEKLEILPLESPSILLANRHYGKYSDYYIFTGRVKQLSKTEDANGMVYTTEEVTPKDGVIAIYHTPTKTLQVFKSTD
jgi:hypothetical protein